MTGRPMEPKNKMSVYLLAIDQGTTNSRAILFNRDGVPVSQHELALKQFYPQDGWVEQDPNEMFSNTVSCCREAIKKVNIAVKEIAAVGIANQRETTIIWDRDTGEPIYPAIVWQDRRTSELCKAFAKHEINPYIRQNTGLLLDPYFSATKILWILQNVATARERAERGELLFGTVDTFLLWKLTQGKSHVTDVTNASRTLLFNIQTQQWDAKILDAFNIPASLLPRVLDNTAHFGEMDKSILGITIPIAGVAGDQQAATIGQACFQPGMVKSTFGTGCFMLMNTGSTLVHSHYQLLSTIAYRFNHQVTYGIEGSIFSAGSIVKWLRDTLKFIHTAAESENLAKQVADTGGVYLVPAFTGLGAPYWDPEARGAILGLTQASEKEHIVRAGLESVVYQTRDLLEAIMSDPITAPKTLRVDGGMAANHWFLQFLSDILALEVQRPACIETTALGVAYLAGLQVGVYDSLDEISQLWRMDSCFLPKMAADKREKLYAGWKRSVERIRE